MRDVIEQPPLYPIDYPPGPFPSKICPPWGCKPSGIYFTNPPPAGMYFSAATPPSGSYQKTSRNISVDGNGNLYAECLRINGSWVQSPPLYYLDCQGDIANIDGVLTCQHAPVYVAPPTPQPLPPQPIPTSGPLPPGAGYQQVEAPGSPYPYVYIGPGTPPAPAYGSPGTVDPWNGYTAYAPGEQVTYGGATWVALAPSIGVPPGVQSSGYWTMTGGSPYASPSTLAVRGSAGLAVSGTGSFASMFNQYKWWILGGLAAVVIVPRLLPRR